MTSTLFAAHCMVPCPRHEGNRGVGHGRQSGGWAAAWPAELARSGAVVFASGRTIEHADLPESVIRQVCDHVDDLAVKRLFKRISSEHGRLDVLVNCVWGGYERMVEDGRFTWALPYWEQPAWRGRP